MVSTELKPRQTFSTHVDQNFDFKLKTFQSLWLTGDYWRFLFHAVELQPAIWTEDGFLELGHPHEGPFVVPSIASMCVVKGISGTMTAPSVSQINVIFFYFYKSCFTTRLFIIIYFFTVCIKNLSKTNGQIENVQFKKLRLFEGVVDMNPKSAVLGALCLGSMCTCLAAWNTESEATPRRGQSYRSTQAQAGTKQARDPRERTHSGSLALAANPARPGPECLAAAVATAWPADWSCSLNNIAATARNQSLLTDCACFAPPLLPSCRRVNESSQPNCGVNNCSIIRWVLGGEKSAMFGLMIGSV